MSQPDFLYAMRHSTAHLLAAAVTELYPEVKLGVGPVVENGFFYDLVTSQPLTENDLSTIEAKMREIQKRDDVFRREEMSLEDATVFFEKQHQPFKVELLRDLKERGTTKIRPEEMQDLGEKSDTASVYYTGNFVDLCRGPHIEHTSQIGAFKLTKLAGAYWRGDEKNPQLQRIYGLTFETQEALDAHLLMLEEAKKRDHKKLGPELDLFTFSELVGSGLPLWTPRGTVVRNLLDQFVWKMREACGYVRVEIPHITKKDLYERSGHWEKFKDELFKIETREGHVFAMKPMNCPHHTQIYARKPWSYRDLPQRYANSTMCYRDEQSGELAGLSRVRAFTQDDAHVFCRLSQAKEEFLKIWDIVHTFYGMFGFSLRVRISRHDPSQPEKYLGDADRWAFAENMLSEIAKEKHADSFDGLGEAAFYGPKLDFMAKDAIGREWQVATIQLDMNMPERFDLTCINEKGEKERIVMIHAAIMGSIERFLSILIEHLAGQFPLWLAPVQVRFITVSQETIPFAKTFLETCTSIGIRAELDDSDEKVGKKIRDAAMMKIPWTVVVGAKEAEGNPFHVRVFGQEEELILSKEELFDRLQKEGKMSV
ncbi:MAG: Threonine-tRNA ligase [Candidatus Uhrbacteria bacterium GW2011_GWF2_41_16]|uniref:Threonine--tRNA ligase n=2 Tax=Candidatus Uhriibacteriota TaxID=1752732 RepID=A0A0G0YE04_9BACT|nr:MAG: Threonine-tRNA ligase [Candidatus Uhrbacteria bacterium GW2011_GWA2_41_10]KKR87567.1 MAG: Threonine-tRNA ligase [Candidatus Uhrbacteria bacterium GW2011_GWC2_41_11]KKR98547.1 MAG: Threonine-tRNA ligase [Candidatus Uhrbacteria bacterium GW2011_GWF2_41_16]HBO99916.1 threonine--tRNA ligase [Candidatus Uhrbacteria bacterium]